MLDTGNWDWSAGKRVLADIHRIRETYRAVHEYSASPDGEKIAALVRVEDGSFTACVNDQPWQESFELMWYLRFSPNGELVSLVRIDDEWTIARDGSPWENRFEYAWNPKFGDSGRKIGLLYKRDNEYGVALDDKTWKTGFAAIRDFCISPDGKRSAATVQVSTLKEADVFEFFRGVWSVAVDGEAWDIRLVNTWNPCFSSDCASVASEVRTDICEYSIAVNGRPWNRGFGCVWSPIFRPDSNTVIAPVRHMGSWTLAQDGELMWSGRYSQLWHQRVSPDGKRVAAVAAPEYGAWTIVVDDKPWPKRFGEMVLEPHFSLDGSKVAALVKQDGRWSVAVDGIVFSQAFEMIWNPVFSPSGDHVMAKAQLNGTYDIIIDGIRSGNGYEMLWDPIFSPEGDMVLLRYVENGNYCREVKPVVELMR